MFTPEEEKYIKDLYAHHAAVLAHEEKIKELDVFRQGEYAKGGNKADIDLACEPFLTEIANLEADAKAKEDTLKGKSKAE